MRTKIIGKLFILLSLIMLQAPFLTPPGHATDIIVDKGIAVNIMVKPTFCLKIDREMIAKIIEQYIEYLKKIAAEHHPNRCVVHLRLTSVEDRTYTEFIQLKD